MLLSFRIVWSLHDLLLSNVKSCAYNDHGFHNSSPEILVVKQKYFNVTKTLSLNLTCSFSFFLFLLHIFGNLRWVFRSPPPKLSRRRKPKLTTPNILTFEVHHSINLQYMIPPQNLFDLFPIPFYFPSLSFLSFPCLCIHLTCSCRENDVRKFGGVYFA